MKPSSQPLFMLPRLEQASLFVKPCIPDVFDVQDVPGEVCSSSHEMTHMFRTCNIRIEFINESRVYAGTDNPEFLQPFHTLRIYVQKQDKKEWVYTFSRHEYASVYHHIVTHETKDAIFFGFPSLMERAIICCQWNFFTCKMRMIKICFSESNVIQRRTWYWFSSCYQFYFFSQQCRDTNTSHFMLFP